MKTYRIKNLTPHEIGLYKNGVRIASFPPQIKSARCENFVEEVGSIPVETVKGHAISVPLVKKRFGKVRALPPVEEGTYYIVSLAVAQVSGRADLLVPHELVRDKNDRVIGCASFSLSPVRKRFYIKRNGRGELKLVRRKNLNP